jgi:hypothetical protein
VLLDLFEMCRRIFLNLIEVVLKNKNTGQVILNFESPEDVTKVWIGSPLLFIGGVEYQTTVTSISSSTEMLYAATLLNLTYLDTEEIIPQPSSTNDIIGIALDMTGGTVQFYRNGSTTGSPINLSDAFTFPINSRLVKVPANSNFND